MAPTYTLRPKAAHAARLRAISPLSKQEALVRFCCSRTPARRGAGRFIRRGVARRSVERRAAPNPRPNPFECDSAGRLAARPPRSRKEKAMKLTCPISVLAGALALGVLPGASSQPYNPIIDSANFVRVVDNLYFPLAPGTTYFFRSQTPD